MLSELFGVFRGTVSPLEFIIQIGAICFVVFCATPIHEYAHALIATKLGDDTPRLSGRLTINPKAHVDLIGALMILVCGFGYAKPVQVRMRNFKNPKRDMALVALAGPVSNLLQAFVYIFLYALSAYLFTSTGSAVSQYMGVFFYLAGSININLAVFNLLPFPPLDGSRLATALLPSRIYYKIMQYERYIQIALFVLLFTGLLSTPLSYVSGLVRELLISIAFIPFNLV